MDDRQRGLFGRWGTWLVLVALVLGLVWRLTYFPIWSADGSSMIILLAFIPVPPLAFVLERVGPVGAIVWVVGACLIERGRVDPTRVGGRWNREWLAIGFAIGAVAVFLGSFGSFAGMAWDLVRTAMGITVLIAAGLYLLWTAERALGAFARRLGFIALSLALVAAALEFVAFGLHSGLVGLSWTVAPAASITSALLASVSLAIWILTYALVLSRDRIVGPAVLPSAEA